MKPTGKIFDPVAGNEAPCGLYIHIPFCETKCGYCDFYSVALKDRNTAPLVDAVIRELELRLAASELPIRTIFCGGGTPTLLPFEQLQRLLEAIWRQIGNRSRLGSGTSGNSLIEEFTVEANPATVEDAKAELLVASGVTRVSMGAQSFFQAELATLERLHSPDDIAPSVEILRRHGVGQINLDLIFGIPGQTLDNWRASLKRAIDLGPDHIACYGLTFEPATRLTAQRNAGRVIPCDEDLEADMFLMTIDVLESAGFRQYEISNYARPSCESKHNLIYWRNQPYIGVGPSAAGCYQGSDEATKRPSDEAIIDRAKRLRRYKNVPDVAEYTRRMERAEALPGPGGPGLVAPIESPAGVDKPQPARGSIQLAEVEAEYIEGETLALEMILMQLRLNEGLSIVDFKERTGMDRLPVFEPVLSRLVRQALVSVADQYIALTRDGRLIANRIIDELAACVGQSSLALVGQKTVALPVL